MTDHDREGIDSGRAQTVVQGLPARREPSPDMGRAGLNELVGVPESEG